MSEVTVRVAGRAYPILCEDGEEQRVAQLAGRIDAEAKALAGAGGQITEARLLLMSALMLADRLDETETALSAAAEAPQAALFDDDDVEQATEAMEDAADRLDALRGADGGAGQAAGSEMAESVEMTPMQRSAARRAQQRATDGDGEDA